ncbi:alcohol dehydrogenase [Aspergillus stella-maris]|uniref:alcohol dehydrogenase n=1 Tax=Aspergillus stella-maris TaxID=1810926 RepID=UPI003CCD0239
MPQGIPETCKAIVLDHANVPSALRDVPVHQPKEDELLVKTIACGVYHSPILLCRKLSTFPGHEVVGTIIAIGSDVKGWSVEQRVGAGWHGGADGQCKVCARAQPQVCWNVEIKGVTRDGGFSEYCTRRADAAICLPETIDPGDTVVICGVGGLGHLAIQYARKMGYRTVAVSGKEDKRDETIRLGAHKFIDTVQEDVVGVLRAEGGASLVMNFVPDPETAVAPGGSLLLIAPVNGVELDFIEMIVYGTRKAINFAIQEDVKCLVKEYPLDKIGDALKAMNDRTIRFWPVIKF